MSLTLQDGIPDYLDPDDDNDGIPDFMDEDRNGDGIPDSEQDHDGDGIPDYLDRDFVEKVSLRYQTIWTGTLWKRRV